MSGSSPGPFSLKIKTIIKVSPESSFLKITFTTTKYFKAINYLIKIELKYLTKTCFNNAS